MKILGPISGFLAMLGYLLLLWVWIARPELIEALRTNDLIMFALIILTGFYIDLISKE
jgi:hypothetical protein